MVQYLWLIPLGWCLGTLGTLIGAGGGFILVPVLLLLYPHAAAETLTSISLAVVFFNALSGSWAYGRMRCIDYKSGLWFAASAVPGAILGALTTDYIPRRPFNGIFGSLMLIFAVYLLFCRIREEKPAADSSGKSPKDNPIPQKNSGPAVSYNLQYGMGLSLVVGYLSSLLGIGGGIIHVPILVRFLKFPVHVAVATSHFILAVTAFTGTMVHIAAGSFAQGGVRRTLCLAVGALIGAQFGAAMAPRVRGVWIIRGLAIALFFVGIRLLGMVF
ncbi:MAG TPA: sulfite exporter TauE/SafE family protein [Anaerohalosphaeraceae bacterium]|nr:sulfite exporter TauE/SafE family protein [Anaerohalosphaeraceae bacterium]